uniref:Uncharacterized protein n=1 Tax=Cannabis sativa TaxID=3483 RepID=A0A803Q6D7_CANSA
MINDLPTTIFEVLTGSVIKQSKEQSTTCVKVGIKMSPPPKDENESGQEEEEDDKQGVTCGASLDEVLYHVNIQCAEIRKIIKNTPSLLAKHLKVGSYKATNAHSSLLLEPKIPADDIMKDWCEVNKEFLLQQLSKNDDSSSSSDTPPPPGDFKDLSTIKSTTNKSDYYWVKASIALINF